ncbi:hypothetical protein BGZ49_004325 [Haplosporangium sp. Z 27]|nr:hypothetical protein BGZ49_004325 [Haplosporangium sp. Z 27]
MNTDEVIWQVINQQFCSYKVKTATGNFCRNEYNATGLCNRQSCPLANSRYATVREQNGVIYLFVKTPERAHSPAKMWEKIKLSKNYAQALEQIDKELIYWPNFSIHKCKQRLTKITQYLIKMRKLKLKADERPKLVGIKKKVDRREARREAKAEAAARLDKAIEKELLDRLKSHAYGDAPLNVHEDVWKEILEGEKGELEVDSDQTDEDDSQSEAEEDEEEDEDDEEREFVSDQSEDEEDMEDMFEKEYEGPIADDQISFTPCFQNTVLFGIPGIIASIAFLIQARNLVKYHHKHSFGRVNILYWPSKIALFGAVLVLFLGLFSGTEGGISGSTLFSSLSLIVAWVSAIRLNHLQSLYSIHSSGLVLVFELLSILFTLPRLVSLYRHQDPTSPLNNVSEFNFQYRYLRCITVAFIFDSWPRGWTSVQKNSGATRHDKANIFSRWTFYFMQPIISLGYRRPLKMEDIQNVMPEYSKTLQGPYQALSLQWEIHVKEIESENQLQKRLGSQGKGVDKEPSLMMVILKTFWKEILGSVVLQLIRSGLQFVLPVLLQQVLIYIESPSSEEDGQSYSRDHGIALALCMLSVSVTLSVVMGQMYARLVETSIKIRSSLVSMIYRKSLVLSPGARKSATTGEITNHMSTDAERWTGSLVYMPMWASLPFEIIVATVLLYRLLGWSVFCGISVVAIITPIQGWAGHAMDSVSSGKMKAQDSRVRLMSEILANIKIIKLYSYVEAFQQKVLMFRNKEVSYLRRAGTIDAFMTILYSCLPLLMAFVSFSVYATVGGPGFTPGDINAQTIFVSISLFGLLNRPVGSMSMVVEATVGLRVAMRRIQGFLLKEEMDQNIVLHIDELPQNPHTPVIQVTDATLAWGPNLSTSSHLNNSAEDTETTALLSGGGNNKTSEPTLFDINVSVARSSLTAVVGRVGQGKSSLLSALIGDMYKRHGTIKIFGSIAYIPQQAWIINATLRENIVFGKPFNQQKYDRILFACGLLPDIEILAAGDQTEIGERGINLSGGQKQRVSLARAAYQDSDIYLFDDPLSAVDAHVDQHLWQNLIGPNGLLNKKTRMIVTHGIHHLEQVDDILMVKNGRISEAGNYSELMKAKKAFYQLIKEFSVTYKSKTKSAKGTAGAIATATSVVVDSSVSSSAGSTVSGDDEEEEADTKAVVEEVKAKETGNGGLIEEEQVKDGIVQWKIFANYCKAMSYYYFVITISLFIVWETIQLSIPLWLEHWISVFDTTEKPVYYFLGIYAVLVLGFMSVDVYLTYVSKVTACMQASVVLHNEALERVMRLPMSFFDSTPQGRVLNRFSSDVAGIDESIPFSFLQTITCFVNLIGHFFIISVATPIFMVTIPPLAILFWITQKYYSRTSSMLKRLESTTKSPIYQHFSETLHGVTSIRAMRLQERFIAESAERVDMFSNAFYAWSMTNRWMNYRLESLATFIIFTSTLLAVLNKDTLSPSLAGLALSFTLVLVEEIAWLLRIFTRFQGDLVCVERVHEYSTKNTEAPLVTGVKIPEQWPSQGHVVFKNYSARYREGLDLVLKNISFEVQPGDKVGIVGRTGAGKSSLTLALFRIIEAADSYWARMSEQEGFYKDLRLAQLQDQLSSIASSGDGGSIEIDGLDISTLGLRDLRKHLAIIPQDPTLFVGTVRENLDPFHEAEDSELWIALERAHLKDHISLLPGGLSFEVSQNGDNFSVGQRSLICLARALLRKTKILILDEATAAVDVETDELIQRTIRKEFKERTILTIAHRIKTVMDSDRILVLEKGRVQEYDSPKELLNKKGSLFYKLAEQAGEI